jgi:hypothetical protein
MIACPLTWKCLMVRFAGNLQLFYRKFVIRDDLAIFSSVIHPISRKDLSMNNRLISAVAVALVSALAGVGITLWLKSNQMIGIVAVSSIVGFFFGLFFKFRLT